MPEASQVCRTIMRREIFPTPKVVAENLRGFGFLLQETFCKDAATMLLGLFVFYHREHRGAQRKINTYQL